MEITLHVMCVVFSVELFATFFFLECIWRYINILWSEGIFSCKLIGFEHAHVYVCCYTAPLFLKGQDSCFIATTNFDSLAAALWLTSVLQ